MPDDNQRFLPILGYGENLMEPVRTGSGGDEDNYPRTYEEARKRVKQQVSTLISAVSEIPIEKKLDEVVVTITQLSQSQNRLGLKPGLGWVG